MATPAQEQLKPEVERFLEGTLAEFRRLTSSSEATALHCLSLWASGKLIQRGVDPTYLTDRLLLLWQQLLEAGEAS